MTPKHCSILSLIFTSSVMIPYLLFFFTFLFYISLFIEKLYLASETLSFQSKAFFQANFVPKSIFQSFGYFFVSHLLVPSRTFLLSCKKVVFILLQWFNFNVFFFRLRGCYRFLIHVLQVDHTIISGFIIIYNPGEKSWDTYNNPPPPPLQICASTLHPPPLCNVELKWPSHPE